MSSKKAKPETRTCSFYAVGKSQKKLLAYDELDSWGDGSYFSDDVYMCDRYNAMEALSIAQEKKMKYYLVEITKTSNKHKIEISLMD